MALAPKDGKLIYHLTSTENLSSIIQNGLQPRSTLTKFDDVADEEIIDFRKKNKILEFIPFHFFAPSPFSGAVQEAHPEKDFVYICIRRDYAKNNDFKIIPQHPISMDNFKFFDYSEGYELINWKKMEDRDYHDDECKHICMAECITNTIIQFDSVSVIFTKGKEVSDKVRKIYRETTGEQISLSILENGAFFKKHD